MTRSMDFPLRRLNGLFMTMLLVVAALLMGAPAGAQTGAQSGGAFLQDGPSHIRPELLAESATPAAGRTVTLAILMRPDKGWHGYWENPGDAGVGMRVEWSAAAGLALGAFRYPVPERLLISGLMNHVYEHDYAILVDVAVPAGIAKGTVLPIRGKAHWLACTDSICVPEQGDITVNLTVGDGAITAQNRTRFDAFRARLPRLLDATAHYAVTGDKIAIAVPYPAAAPVGEPWFFALTRERIAYAAPQTARRNGDFLVLESAIPAGAATTGDLMGVLSVTPDISLKIKAIPGDVPAGGTPIGKHPAAIQSVEVVWSQILLALGGAFLGGLILNIMPCVFPILSLKAISLAKAGGDQKQARAEALAYTLGILATCLALGALMLAIRAGGTQVGWAFQLQDPRVIALLLILMVAITLNLVGVFELSVIGVGQEKAGQGGLGGAFWTGALAAFVATPCSGPFMATAMGAALVLPWPFALAVFAGLGLGLASPFIAIAYIPALRRLLPRPGTWMTVFRRIMAVPMGLTALGLLWLLSRQLGTGGIALGIVLALLATALLIVLGRRQHMGKGLGWIAGTVSVLLLGTAAIATPPLVKSDVSTADSDAYGEPFSEARLAELRKDKMPVFVYFTADWCLTCKVNEANAMTQQVRDAYKKAGMHVLVGDWTSADPGISRFLEANGRSGVPLYLYYEPGQEARTLPQVLTPSMLLDLLQVNL